MHSITGSSESLESRRIAFYAASYYNKDMKHAMNIRPAAAALLLCTASILPPAQQAAPQNGTSAGQAASVAVTKIGSYPCGRQPKQVLFSPDGSYIIMPLLDDKGFDVFSMQEKKVVRRISPPGAEKAGFAEGLFIPEKNAFFVSQMTTGTIHEYSYPDFSWRRSISTEGTWSKFIAWSPEQGLLAVSNWVSDDISLIDYESGAVVRKLKTGKAPRGMVFIDGGKTLVSLSFDSGIIEAFSVQSGKRTDSLSVPKACMRHIALAPGGTSAYVSDMYNRQVYRLSLHPLKITAQVRVFNNPNTIALLGGRWLFVSTRGPNNPADYTKRSPANGKIHIIDTADMSIQQTLTGGNQPTGLDLSPDGSYLCFSDFQDECIELYAVRQE